MVRRLLLALILAVVAVVTTDGGWSGAVSATLMTFAEDAPQVPPGEDVAGPSLPISAPDDDDDDDSQQLLAALVGETAIAGPAGATCTADDYVLGPSPGHLRGTEHPPRT